MGFLLGSILCATGIFVIFKGFVKFDIHTRNAIIVNYITAAALGIFLGPTSLSEVQILKYNWIGQALALGILFVVVFNLMALTAQRNGVSSASVATKMSLIIPVSLSVLLHGEQVNALKILGILIALAAVFLASQNSQKSSGKVRSAILPLLVFIGSGAIDASLKYLSETRVPKNEYPLFSAGIFGSAAISGVIFASLNYKKSEPSFQFKAILGGVVLGVPNYFSIYFLMQALQHQDLSSVTVFTLNNVGVVLCTTLLGLILFKERVSVRNWIGITLAIVSILLVSLS